MFDSGPFAVTTAAQAIFEAPDGHAAVEIFNLPGGPTIYIGGADVTVSGATRGRPIYGGTGYTVETNGSGDDVYVIAAEAVSVQRTRRQRP